MKYTPAQIAKAITAAVTGLSTVGVTIATALSSGGDITADEWAVLIPVISGAILTVIGVFAVPNGLSGDQVVEDPRPLA